MNNKEIKEKFKNLKNISPDINSQKNIRNNVFDFACSNIPVFDKKPYVLNWLSFVKIGAVSFALILIFFIGLNSPVLNKGNQSNLSIENEWKLADISPYLKNIFSNDNKLNQEEFVLEILNEEKKIEKLENSLSVLENNEIDEILDNLIF